MMSLVWASDRLSFRPEWDTSQSLCCEYQKLFCWSEWDKSKSLLWDSVQARMGLESVFIVGIRNCPTGQNGTGQSLYCEDCLQVRTGLESKSVLFASEIVVLWVRMGHKTKSLLWVLEIVLQVRTGHE